MCVVNAVKGRGMGEEEEGDYACCFWWRGRGWILVKHTRRGKKNHRSYMIAHGKGILIAEQDWG